MNILNNFNNLNFCANLVVKDELYTNLPINTPENYTSNLIQKYSDFLDIPAIKKATDGDTIELSKAPNKSGFAIGIKYFDSKSKNVFEGGVFTNKKEATVTSSELIYNTMVCIIQKSGIKIKYSETVPKAFKRAVFELLRK